MSLSLFSNFPKQRKSLPPEYNKIYEKEYIINRTGTSIFNKIALWLEEWMHRKVAYYSIEGERVLELGAGSLNHLKFENGFIAYDVVEPFKELLNQSNQFGLVNTIYSDISEIKTDLKYDRILSIAVLEHLLDLPNEVYQSAMKLSEHGIFVAGIPSEGALLWYLAYKYGTGLGFRMRTGLDYEVFMKYEHVNNAREIESIIRFFFNDVEVFRYPLPFFHLSFYSVIVAKSVNQMALNQYLEFRKD
jgi:2-polyprenyl-3-methyl-5-hydroxy-6-metoxy-1,4-benzoquinol methylase